MVHITNTLPKNLKYTLGQSVENTILRILENLVFAKNAPATFKKPYLLKVDTDLEVLAMKMRLILELGMANETRIFQIGARLEEAGKMLGGWLKSLQ